MAIHGPDSISDALGRDCLSSREKNFVWLALTQLPIFFQWLDSASFPETKIAKILRQNDNIRNEIAYALDYCLIPDSHLQWLDDSDRQHTWLQSIRFSAIPPGHDLSFVYVGNMPQHLVGAKRSAAALDYCLSSAAIAANQRIFFFESLLREWKNLTRLDGYFSWIAEDEEAICDLLWDGLLTRNPSFIIGSAKFSNLDELLSFFDKLQIADLEKVETAARARRAWNQRVRREKMKGQKQRNFILSNKVIEKLDELALKHRLTRTEILELIIESEARSEIYINQRLHRTSLLTSPLTDDERSEMLPPKPGKV